jgi:tRNA G18 (ribose-2'-O)-methylase SpoU
VLLRNEKSFRQVAENNRQLACSAPPDRRAFVPDFWFNRFVLDIQKILSIDDPRLEPYRTMKMQADHHRQRIFVAEGEKVARRLLESPLAVSSVCLPEKWLADFVPLLERRPESIPVFVAEKEQLEKLTGFSMYQGVMAVGKIPLSASVEKILTATARPHFFAAIDAVNNSENIGVLVRNAAAFGVQALLVGETSSSPFMRRAVRSSMGTLFQLPVVECDDLAAVVAMLRSKKIYCVAAHPHGQGPTLYQANLAGDCCIIFGSEGFGLSQKVLEACDARVAVPMKTGVDSLNVGSAAAVFFFEVARQRELQRA